MSFENDILKYAEHPLTSQLLLDLLRDYDRPYDKINDLVKKETLIKIRRGLYIVGKNIRLINPEPSLISNHLYNPSYVSMDTALSHWGMIPERVFETTCCTTRINKKFKTPVGTFSYTNIPLPYYSFGIEKLSLTPKQTILIGSPEKSLCDKIITTAGILFRSKKQVLEYLTEDLRIELDTLSSLNHSEMTNWLPDCPKKGSIELLIKTLAGL